MSFATSHPITDDQTWSWTTNVSVALEFCSVVKVSPPAPPPPPPEEESWSDRLPELEEFSIF